MDKIEGHLEVGVNETNEVVVNHPDLKPDENGIGHIVFSPNQARHLAELLMRNAAEAELKSLAAMEMVPVDRGAKVLVGGKPLPDDGSHLNIDPKTGMQKAYVVLAPEERLKGLVRPVRTRYFHKVCGYWTWMNIQIAETLARDPQFYNGGYCAHCRTHFPNSELFWDEAMTDQVGS